MLKVLKWKDTNAVVTITFAATHPIYFLIERNSKLRRGLSRLPFVIAPRENDVFGSIPD